MNVRKFLAATAFLTILLASAVQGVGQVHSSSSYKYLLDKEEVMEHIVFLSSEKMAGRAAGTSQAREVADYIAAEFESYGLEPFKSVNFFQPFRIPVSLKSVRNGHSHANRANGGTPYNYPQHQKELDACNVVGYVPAKVKNAPYIIVGAHFDHIGVQGEKFYPGADDNASGVAGMLAMAKAFGKRYREKNDLNHNIVFVAFDGNNHSLIGSRTFLARKGIPSYKIDFMVNLDQIGSTLAPVGNYDEYLLVLGADKLKPWQKGQIDFANDYFGLGLCIDYSFYGSEQFYDIFYRLSDQQAFTEQGIPALLFTSGITGHTNKETDVAHTLSPHVLMRRIELIYRFLWLAD